LPSSAGCPPRRRSRRRGWLRLRAGRRFAAVCGRASGVGQDSPMLVEPDTGIGDRPVGSPDQPAPRRGTVGPRAPAGVRIGGKFSVPTVYLTPARSELGAPGRGSGISVRPPGSWVRLSRRKRSKSPREYSRLAAGAHGDDKGRPFERQGRNGRAGVAGPWIGVARRRRPPETQKGRLAGPNTGAGRRPRLAVLPRKIPKTFPGVLATAWIAERGS